MKTMTNRDKTYAPGFTLVELIVVLAIVGILTSMSLPAFMSLGHNAKNELQNGAREIYTLLRAARIHASTYNVNTALVYSLDTYREPFLRGNVNGDCVVYLNNEPAGKENDDGSITPSPPMDSILEIPVRYIDAVALYEQKVNDDFYTPVDGELGYFKKIDGGVVILLNEPDPQEWDAPLVNPYPAYFYSSFPRFDPAIPGPPVEGSVDNDNNRYQYDNLAGLGMKPVKVHLYEDNNCLNDKGEATEIYAYFPAHVFKPSARIDTGGDSGGDTAGGSKERFTIHVARSPAEMPENRLALDPYLNYNDTNIRMFPDNPLVYYEGNDQNPKQNLITIPIELFRSSGRVRIAL